MFKTAFLTQFGHAPLNLRHMTAYARWPNIGAMTGMKRREFVTLVGGAAAAWPLASRAQNTNKAPKRIAFFPDLNQVTLEYWQADMRALGWIEGQDFVVLPSGIEPGSRNPSSEDAQRVVGDKPDLIQDRTPRRAIPTAVPPAAAPYRASGLVQ